MRITLLGPPGGGKRTQADKLAGKLAITHIATGQLFRERVNAGTNLGKAVKSYLDAGDLVPLDVTNALVQQRIVCPDAAGGFILDGYPRSLDQAQALTRMLTARGEKIDVVVELRVDEDEPNTRLSVRARRDDTDVVIRNRLRGYQMQTTPLLDYYRDELITVDGVGSIHEVFTRMLQALGL